MTLHPLLHAAPLIQLHVAAIGIAFILSPAMVLSRKGSVAHRRIGIVWILAMLTAAFSSLFIYTIKIIGPFSPIHLLSLLSLVMIGMGWRAARYHQIARHKWIMLSLIVFALLGAGMFTLMPGRLMHQVMWGVAETPEADPRAK